MYFITAPRITAKNMGLTINLLGQPSGKAERTIKIFSAGKGNNKKRNRQIFLTVSALFLRAYARCRPEGCQYRRCNRCDKLNYKLNGLFLAHG